MHDVHVVLPHGVVDVWQVDLEAGVDIPVVLSPEEVARSERFRRPGDARRWRRGRSALRRLLSRYVDAAPRALVLETASHGKPFLARPASDVRFSVSHAGAVALLAFARGIEVGVDVELRGRGHDAVALARHAFGDERARKLECLPPERREEEFLRAWVRHEATVKCLGTGLGVPATGTADVWVTALDVAPDRLAALAAAREPFDVRLRALPTAGRIAARTRHTLSRYSTQRASR